MKKLIILTIIVLGAFLAKAQQKGFYLTVDGHLGANNFCYTLNGGNKSVPQLGWGGSLGLQYFFTRHWGIGTGLGISFYNSRGNYSNSSQDDPAHYAFNGMHDDDLGLLNDNYKDYTLLLGLDNWTETQTGYFLEVPLMLRYQTKWGKAEKVGMYFGVGAKVQIPIISQKYGVKDGSQLSVSAYYPIPDLTLPDSDGPDVSVHGYGVNTKTGYKGDMDLKISFAASAELGFLFSLSRRVDLTLGAYLDYGFNNIKKDNKTSEAYLISPENGEKTIQPSSYVGDHLQYQGYINSYTTENVNLLGMGWKIGLRIKLGKLTESEIPLSKTESGAIAPLTEKQIIIEKSRVDTIYVIDTAKYQTIGTVSNSDKGVDTDVKPKNQLTQEEMTIITEPIFFDLDKDILRPASIAILNEKVKILKKYPAMQLLITGNTCDLGNEEYDMALGLRRAVSAQKYLESQGINKAHISTVSKSSSEPLKPNNSEENREWNRRCDFFPMGY